MCENVYCFLLFLYSIVIYPSVVAINDLYLYLYISLLFIYLSDYRLCIGPRSQDPAAYTVMQAACISTPTPPPPPTSTWIYLPPFLLLPDKIEIKPATPLPLA